MTSKLLVPAACFLGGLTLAAAVLIPFALRPSSAPTLAATTPSTSTERKQFAETTPPSTPRQTTSTAAPSSRVSYQNSPSPTFPTLQPRTQSGLANAPSGIVSQSVSSTTPRPQSFQNSVSASPSTTFPSLSTSFPQSSTAAANYGSGNGTSSNPSALNSDLPSIEVGEDAVIPASLARPNPENGLTPDQQSNVNELAEGFLESVNGQSPTTSEAATAWTEEQRWNDAMFKLRVGYQAFNAMHAQAYRESLPPANP